MVLAAAGCSENAMYDLDGGAMDAAVVEARSLEIVGDPTVSLAGGDTADLTVQLRDPSGAPLAGETVRFALDGRAHDSTLETVTATTDAMGLAHSALQAGTVVAAFRVRASADDAASVSFDVAVGDAGFGSMQVTPEYVGERETLPRVVVGLFADADCEDDFVRRDPGDRLQVLSEDDELVRFLGLPAGVSFAVAVRAEGEGGTVLAWGCEDRIAVEALETTDVDVTFDDEPLVVDGSYQTTSVFPTTTGEDVATALEGARDALLPASDATLILDAAEATLSGAEATELRAARASGFDATYQTALESLGPAAAHEALIDRLRTELTSLTVVGRLRATEGELDFSVLRLGMGAGELEVALTELTIETSLDATLDSEELRVSELLIDLSASELVRALATREAFDRLLDGPSAWLASAASCAALPPPEEPIGCDAVCLQAACRTVLADYWTAALTVIEALDQERSTLELDGSANVADLAGDLQVDTLEGSLAGEWTGPSATSPEALEGTFSGERITPPR
ncbi:MAG: hypothetical protein CMN30_04080 [Sandaracinus sp.]|nr:hypothetical protein [Sandaracinus sp.]